MRTRIVSRALPALAVLASVAMPTSAHAAFVTTWDYEVTSSFSNVEDDGGFGTITTSPDNDEITWGANGRFSSIGAVDTPTSGSVETNGAPAPADDYFHNNFVIPLGARSLTSTTLTVEIALTPTSPAGTPLAPPLERSFDINFFETPNAGSNGVCADGGAVGAGVNSAGCADIFTLEFDFGQFNFEFDGEQYSAFLFEDPESPGFPQLDFLSDEACTSVGAGTGCFGFLTAEDERTVAEFVVSVEGEAAVPEPAALGLLGLGLLGLSIARRRKTA